MCALVVFLECCSCCWTCLRLRVRLRHLPRILLHFGRSRQSPSLPHTHNPPPKGCVSKDTSTPQVEDKVPRGMLTMRLSPNNLASLTKQGIQCKLGEDHNGALPHLNSSRVSFHDGFLVHFGYHLAYYYLATTTDN